MTILTAAEAANVLRCATDDALMLQLLGQVDAYINRATGRDWSADATISPRAKAAAQMLLTMWHENPAMTLEQTSLTFGLTGVLSQMESDALRYRSWAFWGLSAAGGVYLPQVRKGDRVVAVVGLTGVSGDQSASFESVISTDFALQQTSAADLSDYQYRVTVIAPADVVGAL